MKEGAVGWVGTCGTCKRLVHKEGWFRDHPAGGYQVGTSTGTGCQLMNRASEASSPDPPSCWAWGCKLNCTTRVFTASGWRHRDCGLAEYAGAPLATSEASGPPA